MKLFKFVLTCSLLLGTGYVVNNVINENQVVKATENETLAYTISFVGTQSSSTALTTTTLKNYISQGEDKIGIISKTTKLYPSGNDGLKFGSSSKDGELTFSLNENAKINASKIVVNAKRYGSDSSTLSVNGLSAQTLAATDSFANYTFTLDSSALTSIDLKSTKRIYVKNISVYTNNSGTGSGSGSSSSSSEVNPPVTEKYTVTFNSNGGSAVTEQEVESGSTATKPDDPTREGYTFAGWYKDENCSQSFNFTTDKITQNTTLYADWDDSSLLKYIISFKHDTNSGDSLTNKSTSDKYINEGANFISGIVDVAKVYPYKTSLKFSSSSADGHIKMSLSDEGKVYASKIVIYASEYDADEKATLSINDNDSDVKTISGVNNKYTFNLDVSNMITSIKLTATNRLYLNSINVYYKPVEKVKYQVNFISDGVSLDPVVADATTHLVQEPTGLTKDGYILEGWYKDEAYTQPFKFDEEVPEDGLTLYAKWEEDLTGLIKESITREETGASTSYTTWNYTTFNFTAFNGYSSGGNESIQLNDDAKYGIVIKSNHNLKRIVIQWNANTSDDRTINIYGSKSEYSSISELSNQTAISSVSKKDSQDLKSDVTFEKNSQFNNIGIRSKSHAIYISSITFYWSENFYWDETTIDNTEHYEFSVGQTQPSLGFSYEMDSSSNYTFNKIRLQFKAVISSDLFNKVAPSGAGIEITTNVGGANKKLDIDCSSNIGATTEGDRYILGSLIVPDDQFATVLTARAYFVAGGKKVYYKETSYSIKEIINEYNDFTQFDEEVVNALTALKDYIANK